MELLLEAFDLLSTGDQRGAPGGEAALRSLPAGQADAGEGQHHPGNGKTAADRLL